MCTGQEVESARKKSSDGGEGLSEPKSLKRYSRIRSKSGWMQTKGKEDKESRCL